MSPPPHVSLDAPASPYLRNVSLTIDDGPRDVDVLCGSKSKAVAAHKGNELLRQKIEASIDAYLATQSLQERITLNRSIVTFMRQEYGTRFLKRATGASGGGGDWMLAEDQAIRDKISHALRFAAQQRKRQQEQQQQQGPTTGAVSTTTTSTMIPFTAAVPSAFARQQEILQGILQPSTRKAMVTIPLTAVSQEQSSVLAVPIAAADNIMVQDIPITMVEPFTSNDKDKMQDSNMQDKDLQDKDMNDPFNTNMDKVKQDKDPQQDHEEMEEITEQDLLQAMQADVQSFRRYESSALPNMAAQVSIENLDYQDAAVSHNESRQSAVNFASLLSSLSSS